MKWVSAFSYLPINYAVRLAEAEDQTQQLIFDNNLAGGMVRVRFSNKYSRSPLRLDKVTVGIREENAVRHVLPVTLRGSGTIVLAPGEETWSDEVELAVRPGDRIAVTTYVGARQSVESVCAFWCPDVSLVRLGRGDHTAGGAFPDISARDVYPVIREDANPVKAYFFYGLSGLQVLTDDHVKTVVMFGDSITHMSFVSGALARRLFNAYPGKVTLLNRGLGGNRLLHDATKVDILPAEGACFGDAGVTRFAQDVFGQEPADAVLVLEGINDIMHPIQFGHPDQQVTGAALEDGFRRLIETAHRHGARIFGATVTPSGHDDYPDDWLPRFEAVRLDVNSRVRAGFGFDGYFDYDAAVRDETRPGYMLPECHSGDGLHPNTHGGQLMAGQIDLRAIMD